MKKAALTLAGKPQLLDKIQTSGKQFQPTDKGATETTNWVKNWFTSRNRDRPFFLFINYIEPHAEYRPFREYAEIFLPNNVSYEEAMAIKQDPRAYDANQYDLTNPELKLLRALYRAEIASIDEQLGRLMDLLLNTDEQEETLFVVLGDHGENIGEHGLFGHQYSMYDTVLHVPLIIYGGEFAGGPTNDQLVQPLDLVPTLLE